MTKKGIQKQVQRNSVAEAGEQAVATQKKFSLVRDERWPLTKLEQDYTIILDSFDGWITDINESLDLIRRGRDAWGLQSELESAVENVTGLVVEMEASLRWCNVERHKDFDRKCYRKDEALEAVVARRYQF